MAIQLRLAGLDKDLGGGFTVRRLLPAARQRSVGPFIFFDHFGPVTVPASANYDVRPHPHIGLATVTYLFEGAMMHRDSLGNQQLIEPGAINWMTAGRGIVHSERRPEHLRDRVHVNHGLQLWTALPLEHEEDDPSFSHTPASALPQLQVGDARVRVLVGQAFGAASPVATYSRTLYLDLMLPAGGRLELPVLAPELAVFAVAGELSVDGEAVAPQSMAVLDAGAPAVIAAGQDARFVVIGGDPLDRPRHMWWNFVSSDRERILRASADWEAQRMGQVPGEHEFIPLPPARFVPPEPLS
ncbi:MAG TPA: pirin family protein [Ramlibacter sp.]|nr:pirin family protein [Ramlibacter sp.]